MATAFWVWFFLPAGNGVPEHMIAADPGFWVHSLIDALLGEGASIEPEVMEDYIRCFRDPKMVAASCADFRSGMSTDLGHDEETFAAGQQVECLSSRSGGRILSSAAATSRSAYGSSTHPMSAVTRCPPATSLLKKHRTWSARPCGTSSTSARAARIRGNGTPRNTAPRSTWPSCRPSVVDLRLLPGAGAPVPGGRPNAEPGGGRAAGAAFDLNMAQLGSGTPTLPRRHSLSRHSLDPVHLVRVTERDDRCGAMHASRPRARRRSGSLIPLPMDRPLAS
jgi:hypothetical protein